MPRVLIVEDVTPIRELLNDFLSDEGYDTLLAENGWRGVEIARSEHHDLVLMDLEMPVMNGYETTTYIRQRLESKKDIPIIIITGREGLGEATRCLLLGANTFLTKPVTEENLIKEINTLML